VLPDPKLIPEPRLVRHHLSRLGGARHAVEALERLPPIQENSWLSTHDDERPPGPGILNVGIVQKCALQRSIVGSVVGT
jgi:hypothetical protein